MDLRLLGFAGESANTFGQRLITMEALCGVLYTLAMLFVCLVHWALETMEALIALPETLMLLS